MMSGCIGDELLALVDAPRREGDAGLAQRPDGELGVGRLVLEHEHLEFVRHFRRLGHPCGPLFSKSQ
jgi:hypothetical protein